MKKFQFVVFLTIITTLALPVKSQHTTTSIEDFEDNKSPYIIIANPNSSWQIGHANKGGFIDTASGSRCIVTDTINPYPINNVSSFIVKFNYKLENSIIPYHMTLFFKHRFNTDSLHDYGRIDISYDKGANWYQMANYPVHINGGPLSSGGWAGITDTVVIRGNSHGWQNMAYHWKLCYAIKPDTGALNILQTEELLIKFTFISDNIPDNKEGWAIDDIKLDKYFQECAGINELELNKPKIWPVPTDNVVNIEFVNAGLNGKIKIFNVAGMLIGQYSFTNSKATINTSKLLNGLYYLKFENSTLGLNTINKVIIQH